MYKKSYKQEGFSLMKLLIIMAIIGILAIIGPPLWEQLFGSQRKIAEKHIANIETALGSYRLDMFKYPSSLDDLVKNSSNSSKWQGPYLAKGLPKDPWGNNYQYHKLSQDYRDYDVYSFGADGLPGGEGNNADIVSRN